MTHLLDHQATDQGRAAIIIGAGVAGLLAAAALSPYMRRVTIIEQDDLSGGPAPRRRVPQGNHVHALLDSGRRAIEQLVPGYQAASVAKGAQVLPVRSRWRSHDGRGWAKPQDTGPVILSQSRGQMEHVLRGLVLTRPNVEIVQGRVTGLLHDEARRVTGVCYKATGQAPQRLNAAWVVDASGRAGQTGTWVTSVTGTALPEQQFAPDISYTSLLLQRPATPIATTAWLHLAQAPRTRGLVLAPIEGDLWIATITDRFGARVPCQAPEFLRCLREGFDPSLRAQLTSDQSYGSVNKFHIGSVRLRSIDAPGLPLGLLPLGDAVSTFNPLHAQGMSVAALQALALQDSLRVFARQDPAAVQRRYLQSATEIAQNAWQIGQAVDLAYPQLQAQAETAALRLSRRLQATFAAATMRPNVARKLDRILHMLDPISELDTLLAHTG